MDIDVEIQIKEELKAIQRQAITLAKEAIDLERQAESTLANGIEAAYKRGASVVFIASTLDINRQRVYLLLATKGIRPGKEVGVTDG